MPLPLHFHDIRADLRAGSSTPRRCAPAYRSARPSPCPISATRAGSTESEVAQSDSTIAKRVLAALRYGCNFMYIKGRPHKGPPSLPTNSTYSDGCGSGNGPVPIYPAFAAGSHGRKHLWPKGSLTLLPCGGKCRRSGEPHASRGANRHTGQHGVWE